MYMYSFHMNIHYLQAFISVYACRRIEMLHSTENRRRQAFFFLGGERWTVGLFISGYEMDL